MTMERVLERLRDAIFSIALLTIIGLQTTLDPGFQMDQLAVRNVSAIAMTLTLLSGLVLVQAYRTLVLLWRVAGGTPVDGGEVA